MVEKLKQKFSTYKGSYTKKKDGLFAEIIIWDRALNEEINRTAEIKEATDISFSATNQHRLAKLRGRPNRSPNSSPKPESSKDNAPRKLFF